MSEANVPVEHPPLVTQPFQPAMVGLATIAIGGDDLLSIHDEPIVLVACPPRRRIIPIAATYAGQPGSAPLSGATVIGFRNSPDKAIFDCNEILAATEPTALIAQPIVPGPQLTNDPTGQDLVLTADANPTGGDGSSLSVMIVYVLV